MPRETKAERLARQEQERAAVLKAAEEWKSTKLPLLMLHLLARAERLGATVELRLEQADDLPAVVAADVSFPDCSSDDFTVTTDAEEWQFNLHAGTVLTREHEVARQAAKLKLARETFDSLTPEQREALGLTSRP